MKKVHKKIYSVWGTLHNWMPVVLGLLFFGIVFIIYHGRVASFIFFDEYASFVAAYFMHHGKSLYSDNFYNHQMLPVYLSYLIQRLFHPASLYTLYLYHRLFIIAFSFVWGMFLIFRTRWVGLGFILLFEISKYYLFGNLFLAESMIVYPVVYLFFLSWQRIHGKNIAGWETIIAGIAAWFIIFSREPYVPLAVILYGVVLVNKKMTRQQWMSLAICLILSAITILSVPLKEYFFQIVSVNYRTIFLDEVHKSQSMGLGPLAIVFYPVLIFFKGEQTFFRYVLIMLSVLFTITIVFYTIKIKQRVQILFVLFVLALANIRVIIPGTEFYSAFHMIQWYALFIVSILLFMNGLKQLIPRSLFGFLIGGICIILLFLTIHPASYLWDKFDAKRVFTYQYDMFYVNGQAIKIMAKPQSTLFVDMSDSLLYWTADIPSSYSYSVYYPVMNEIAQYRSMRMTMFQETPPDFYYVNCLEGIAHFNKLPNTITNRYMRLTFNGSPTCFFVKRDVLRHLTHQQISELNSLRFSFDSAIINGKQ